MIKIRLQLSIILYLLMVGILIYLNPDFIYDEKGHLKVFGTGDSDHTTIYPLWLIILLFSFLSYYLSNLAIYLI